MNMSFSVESDLSRESFQAFAKLDKAKEISALDTTFKYNYLLADQQRPCDFATYDIGCANDQFILQEFSLCFFSQFFLFLDWNFFFLTKLFFTFMTKTIFFGQKFFLFGKTLFCKLHLVKLHLANFIWQNFIWRRLATPVVLIFFKRLDRQTYIHTHAQLYYRFPYTTHLAVRYIYD